MYHEFEQNSNEEKTGEMNKTYTPAEIIETYKELLTVVKTNRNCTPESVVYPLPFCPESRVNFRNSVAVLLSNEETCMELLQNDYLKLIKELFLESNCPHAKFGIIWQCVYMSIISQHAKSRPMLWNPPEDNIFQALVLLTMTVDSEIKKAAREAVMVISNYLQVGEFDFLRPLRKEEYQNEVFQILEQTNILYQATFDQEYLSSIPFDGSDADLRRYLQTKSEFAIHEIPLTYKLGTGIFQVNDVLAMTDEQLFIYLPVYATHVRFFQLRFYHLLAKHRKKEEHRRKHSPRHLNEPEHSESASESLAEQKSAATAISNKQKFGSLKGLFFPFEIEKTSQKIKR